jgi:phosphoserine phosphatase
LLIYFSLVIYFSLSVIIHWEIPMPPFVSEDGNLGLVAQTKALPSWNDGPAKQAIIDFVARCTDETSSGFVPPANRIATFDQDGTLWVEQPIYTQAAFAVERLAVVAKQRPELNTVEPFKSVLSGDRAAIKGLTMKDLEPIAEATHSGMTVDAFYADVAEWVGRARHPRFGRHYTELTYQPMHEVMAYLSLAGFALYIVTGGGQDFVRVFAEETYGIARNRVVGSVLATRFGHDAAGLPVLTKIPALTLNNDLAAKPEGIHMMIGRRPIIAFGNSAGDEAMLEYAAGGGAGMGLLLLHDDAVREYAYGPANGLPQSGIGAFPQALYDRAMTQGWTVISMKDDWNRVFAFE